MLSNRRDTFETMPREPSCAGLLQTIWESLPCPPYLSLLSGGILEAYELSHWTPEGRSYIAE